MNMTEIMGSALVVCASVLLHYWRFIILETLWMLVSMISVIKII